MQMVPSDQTKEEESTMLRIRLASLTLASAFLLTLSGCCSFCEDGKLFPRLFNHTSRSRGAMVDGVDCECHRPGFPHGVGVPAGQGPFLVPSTASNPTSPIPITNVPAGQPPIFKVPPAPPTAYVP